MTETDPEGMDRMQHDLQDVLLSLRHLQGAPPSEVREQVERGLTDAGLPTQPDSWLRDAAAEISAGRLVVVGAKEIPQEAEALEPEPDQHASG